MGSRPASACQLRCRSCQRLTWRIYKEDVGFGSCKCGGTYEKAPNRKAKELQKVYDRRK